MTEKYQSREERRRLAANKKAKSKGKQKPKKLFKKIFMAFVILGIIGLLTGAATFAFLVKDAPKIDEALLKDPISSKIYDKDGNLIREVGTERREYVDYEDIPEVMKNAVLATEDVRFFKHSGVDIIRIGGAVVANITGGFGSEGASTITQQLVKNSFLNPEKTIKRKAQEAWLAFQLERKYTKKKIFEMYVNKNNMSQGVHGIATASKVYFDKELKELEVQEAALLAGLFQSPNRYNPFKHPERAEKRRNVVLTLMNQHGFISKEEMEKAKSIPVTASLIPEEERKTDLQPFDFFIDRVIDEVEELGDYNIFADGLKVYTTLDSKAQTHVEKILDTDEIIQYPDEKFQAGITLLDTKTGEIRALGGGRNQEVQRGFNFATDTKRQPGSTIKPILDYGPAIEHLKWSTYHQLNDKQYAYSDGTPINNWDNKFMGQMSIREALGRSRNIPALQALQAAGLDKAKEFAVNLGIPLEEIHESYSVGGLKEGVSPLQMAGAYSAFGNNGVYNEPYAVKKIELRDGTVIDTTPESQVVMKDYTAFMITDMLKEVLNAPYGTGRAANIPNLHVAGKTGTTNYTDKERGQFDIPKGAVPDAWFAGYTTNYSLAVWTGYENRSEYIPSGNSQKIAQHIFKNLMEEVSKDVETPDFEVPKSVVKIGVEKGSNPPKLPSKGTPKDAVTYEYFVKGHEPKAVSQKFEKIDAPKGLNAKYDEAANEIALSWDYKDSEVEFEVTMSVNGGQGQQLAVTSDKGVKVANPQPGASYTFKVTAIANGRRSSPATAAITIPGPATDEEDEDKDENPDEDNEDKDDENPQDGTNEPAEPADGTNGPPQPGDGTNNGNGNNSGNDDKRDDPGNNGGDNGGNGDGGTTPPPPTNGDSNNNNNNQGE
ncbi:PBP1A family penicillin-binding protein [Bacillus aquiflavi]|uniref:penicillin-binding protein 1A n=1 Tax=Bacillus aquiflavi TaxID=2672567 RepID=UPI001CA89BA7|nr:penicillin-binding protein 1A [Bacillus aquiflavi]UAC47041.1 PBP1A family penicillin-binding protein [Bacillus aquiflavi]